MLASRIFVWGGGGVVQGRLVENSLNNVFFFFFISLFYSLQRESDCLSMVLFQRKLYFPGFRGSSIINPGGGGGGGGAGGGGGGGGGSTIFQGVQLFQGGGSKCYFQ